MLASKRNVSPDGSMALFKWMTGSSTADEVGTLNSNVRPAKLERAWSKLPFTNTMRCDVSLAKGDVAIRRVTSLSATAISCEGYGLSIRARKSVQRHSSMRRCGSDTPKVCSAAVNVTPPSPQIRHSHWLRVPAPIPCRQISRSCQPTTHAQNLARCNQASADNG